MPVSNTPRQVTPMLLERNHSFALALQFELPDGRGHVDLTGGTITFTALQPPRQGTAVVLTKVAVLDSPTTGHAVLDFQAADLDLEPAVYPYSATFVDVDNYSSIILKGELQILSNADPATGNVYDSQALTIELGLNEVTVTVNHLAPPDIIVGAVTTIAYGNPAGASFRGAYPHYTLDLSIPRGAPGGSEAAYDEAFGAAVTAANAHSDAGDATLQANINAEALTRGNADTALQASINATQAELDAYETSNDGVVASIISTMATDAEVAAIAAAKADLASPALTGNPTAPTPATTDSDTSIATTAFGQAVGALARVKRWGNGISYNIGDVVGYAGGVYRCTAAPTAGLPPALNTGAWEVAVPPTLDGWAVPDPYFASTDFTNTWNTFWHTGTINSLAYTTTAGEFEQGKRALKIDLAANSSQRLYGLSENLVKGGEVLQVQARVKYLSGTAGQVTCTADLIQNDESGPPEPLSGGTSTGPAESAVALTNAWQTVTFTITAVNAKPRAMLTFIINSGTAAAVVVVDRIKVTRNVRPAIRVSRAASMSLTSGVETFIPMTATTWTNKSGMLDGNGRLVVPETGVYSIKGFASGNYTGGAGEWTVALYNNTTFLSRQWIKMGSGSWPCAAVEDEWFLVAGSTVELRISQTSGGAIGTVDHFLRMRKLDV